MQSIDSIETCAYGTSKYLVKEKESIKCTKYKAIQKTIDLDYVAKEKTKNCSSNFPQIPNHS